MAKKAMRMMDKVAQTVEVGGKAVFADVRSVFLKGGLIRGWCLIGGRKHHVQALGNQCWREVA